MPERTSTATRDFIALSVVAAVALVVAVYFDMFERFERLAQAYERWQVDELVVVPVVLALAFGFYSWRRRRELRESEERYRAVMEQSVEAIYLYDVETKRVLQSNSAFQRLMGYAAEELLGMEIYDFIAHDKANIDANIRRSLKEKRRHIGERRYRRKDGSIIVVDTSASVISYDGKTALCAVSRDVTERKQTEEMLKESEERFRLLAENARDLIFLYRLKPTPGFEYVSPSATAIIGYTPEELYADPEMGLKIVHPDDRHLIDEVLRHPEVPATIRWLRKDGTVIWTEQRNKPIYDEAGELAAIEGISRDITERKRAEETLRHSEERYRAILEEQTELVCRFLHDLTLTFVNDAYCRYFGKGREELIGSSFMEHIPAEDHVYYEGQLSRLSQENLTRTVEHRVFIPGGDVRWQQWTDRAIFDEEGRIVEYQSVGRDITERKTLEEQLEHDAFHDSLTDLPNRHLFMDRLKQTLRRTRRRRKRKVAVLFLDLDGFKVVNDSLGHKVGDELLVAVAERLQGLLRPEDTLARLGGDEFSVLIEDIDDPDEARRVAGRFVETLREPFVIEERELFVRASIGIALGDAHAKSSEELLRDADTAMYRAKEDAADYRVFDPNMYERVRRRLELENALRRALEKEEFRVYYQPKFRLGQPDRIESVEALVRWEHPQRGLMLPDDFIPIAEETGLIISIGGWVMREACRQAKEWQERYPGEAPLSVCVNLSAGQVRHPGLLQDVSSTLRESGLEASSLILEITEGALLKDTEVLETIFGELKALGVRLAIDDFGKEYSSLSYLKRLPVDGLKIDGSFVESLGKDSSSTTIVEAVISLAHSLGLEVTAEGVQSAEQLEHLSRMGCDLGQGYQLARPLPSEEVELLLADQPVY